MRRNLARQSFGPLAATALVLLTGVPLDAAQGDRFAYKLEIAPYEGPLNPIVEQRYTKQLPICQKHAAVTYEIAACFEAEFVRQDAILNRTWRTVLGRLPSSMHDQLVIAQRKWAAARDPFCKADVESFGTGTIAPIAYSDCRAELTIRRTIWLEKLR